MSGCLVSQAIKWAEPPTVAAVRSLLSFCCFAEHPCLTTCSHSALNCQKKKNSSHKKCLRNNCPVPSNHTVILKLLSKITLQWTVWKGRWVGGQAAWRSFFLKNQCWKNYLVFTVGIQKPVCILTYFQLHCRCFLLEIFMVSDVIASEVILSLFDLTSLEKKPVCILSKTCFQYCEVKLCFFCT